MNLTATNGPYAAEMESPFGPVMILWIQGDAVATIRRIVLSTPGLAARQRIQDMNPGPVQRSCQRIDRLLADISRFMEGEPLRFMLDGIDFGMCPPFQRRVLRAEHRIPRGRVATYGAIARHLGAPRSARAVGGALARNPFPIIIPCHRAVGSDGRLGGYQGGVEMKQRLLELEGVRFRRPGLLAAPLRGFYP